MRRDAEGAPFVGAGDEPEEQLGAVVIEGREADLVDLCRGRHRSTYADPATMPTGWRWGEASRGRGVAVVGIVAAA